METRAAGLGAFRPRRRRSMAGLSHTRSGDAYTAVAVLGIALLVSIVGSAVTYAKVHQAFSQHGAVDRAMTGLDALYRIQLEEDTGLRGYLASGDRLYLAPYYQAQPDFDRTWDELRDASAQAELQSGDAVVADLRHSHDRWEDEVAQPLVDRPNAPDAVARLHVGKAFMDRMSADFRQLTALYGREAQAASDRIQTLLRRAAISTAALILLFGLAAIVADLFRSRTQLELERERGVADTLQGAFLSGWDSVPRLRVGTAYVSATREAAVGGDLFDIHRIDDHRSLLLVADVSGKGLHAAVETAQVKYSIRTLVEDWSDPAIVLAKFNRAFLHSSRDPSSFVSAFVGVIDDRDWTLQYASAGHAPAFVRRGFDVEQLAVTGPLLGVTETASYSSSATSLRPGDTVVLATDGITEARDHAGVLVGDDGVIAWIRNGEADPELLAAELVSRVKRFSGGRISDDLALLILRVDGPPGAAARGAREPEAVAEPAAKA